MFKKIFFYLLFSLLAIESGYANELVSCRSLTHGSDECNPYSLKFLKTKDIKYINDRKKPIVSKTLPTPKPIDIKIFSVQEIMDRYIKYIKISDSIRFANQLNQDNISNKNNKEDKNKTKPSYGTYTVVNGDILGRIANKFSISLQEIKKLNTLESKSRLKIGQKLIVPYTQEMIDAISSGEYKIKKGDTFILIAKKFGIDLKIMKKYNNLKNTQMIKEGDILKLPLPYILDKKKTIAKKSKVSKKKKLKRKYKTRFIRNLLKHRLRVTATAYSSHSGQTDSTPFLAAWNNRIRPGMKIIAVSRDLLRRYGIRNGTKVHIAGLRGYYTVRDKMNKRFKKRIDIYMGLNRRRALHWGRRSVVIYW